MSSRPGRPYAWARSHAFSLVADGLGVFRRARVGVHCNVTKEDGKESEDWRWMYRTGAETRWEDGASRDVPARDKCHHPSQLAAPGLGDDAETGLLAPESRRHKGRDRHQARCHPTRCLEGKAG